MSQPTPNSQRRRLFAQIDRICDEFESRWVSGDQPGIGEFLEQVGKAERGVLLKELLAIEAHYLRSRGEHPERSQYLERFDGLQEVAEDVYGQFFGGSMAEATAEITSEAHPTPSSHAGTPTDAFELEGKFGRYEILSKLGSGGMGAVYLARDTKLERNVALKIPRLGKAPAPELIERFHREARAMASLNHSNLCPVYDVGECNGIYYLTMQFLEGNPLSFYLGKDRFLRIRDAVMLVHAMAIALAEAHDAGVVHRDLKPDNVMINKRNEPIIMDFGFARTHQSGDENLTHLGTIVGTPSYMSPEQVEGDADTIGPATDIYSLGVILYQLLTGRRPFEGSVASILGKIVVAEPKPVRSIRDSIPIELEEICEKAMAKQIDDRFPDCPAFARALAKVTRQPKTPAGDSSEIVRPTLSKSVHFIGHLAGVTDLRVTGDGQIALSVDSDSTMRCWMTGNGVQRTRFESQTCGINTVDISNNGRFTVSGGADGVLRFWEVDSGQQRGAIRDRNEAVYSVRFRRRRRQVISAGEEGPIHIWSLEDSSCLAELTQLSRSVRCLALSQDDTLLAAGNDDGVIKIWDLRTLQTLFTGQHASAITSLEFEASGEHLLSSSLDCSVRIWNISTGHEHRRFVTEYGRPVLTATFAADGDLIVSGGRDNQLRVWNVRKQEEICHAEAHRNWITKVVAYGNDQHVLSSSFDRTVCGWEIPRLST